MPQPVQMWMNHEISIGSHTRNSDDFVATNPRTTSRQVDFCVHSTKDVPTELIPDTELCTMLPREDWVMMGHGVMEPWIVMGQDRIRDVRIFWDFFSQSFREKIKDQKIKAKLFGFRACLS